MQHAAEIPRDGSFFSRDGAFYRGFFRLFLILALQNIVTYSVNVADNVMLGAYSQTALSGAAAVNQIQYVLQQFTNMGLGEGLVVLCSQYWGRRRTDEIQRLTGAALCTAMAFGGMLTAAAFAAPEAMAALFTDDAAIQAEAVAYLRLMRWSYLAFMATGVLLAALRSVQVVGVAFRLSVMTLVVNAGINNLLIFGRFGLPELGIRGAAIGTLTARYLELAVLLCYCAKSRALPFRFRLGAMFPPGRGVLRDYLRVTAPCAVSALLFSGAVAMQTVIFGHLSADAIAANSAAGTLFQYCKMIPISASAATAVWIGKMVGRGDWKSLRATVHTLQALYAALGLVVAALLLAISGPILSLYDLSDGARACAARMIAVLAVTSVGTAYEMPCLTGIIRGGGDTGYVMRNDIIYSWLVTVPLSLAAAFWWKWPVPAVTFCMNVDQILKCFTVGWKTNRYTWIKKLTKGGNDDADPAENLYDG